MKPTQIDLNLFTVFDAIYQDGGITAASKRLHLSQPAVSHALRRLREVLGDPLFQRKGNVMIPTARARELAGTVRTCLEQLDRISERSARFEPATASRRLRIALRQVHEVSLLPQLCAQLERDAPGVLVETVRVERSTMEEDLRSGELDLAIDVELPHFARIRRELLGSERLVVLAREGHPRVRGELDLATYFSLDHILVTGRRHGMGYEDAALGGAGFARRIRVRCQQHEAASALVSQSDMIATLPYSDAALVNREGKNQLLPLPIATPALRAFLYWHSEQEADSAHRWFRRVVRDSWRTMRGHKKNRGTAARGGQSGAPESRRRATSRR
jgi:DNA-binding transcriptional LysR family regulator